MFSVKICVVSLNLALKPRIKKKLFFPGWNISNVNFSFRMSSFPFWTVCNFLKSSCVLVLTNKRLKINITKHYFCFAVGHQAVLDFSWLHDIVLVKVISLTFYD